MLLTLNANALRSRLAPSASHRLKLTDIPAFAKGELGVNGLVLSADLLAGADRPTLQRVLEAADKAGCPILVLMETTAHALGSNDILTVEKATDRCIRVAQAANWLGCSAFALTIQAPDDDETLANVAANLKPISRKAEKLDLNLCIAPAPGLTATPERVTEVLKKIGGFRVGTLPDFGGASETADPVQYLRRLVPYASAVLVPATNDDAALEAAEAASKRKAAAKPAEAPAAKPAKSKAKGKKKKDEDDDTDEAPTPAPVLTAVKGSYDLVTYAQVLDAVGYEGPITLDFRGSGDPMPALLKTRDILIKTLTAPVPEESSGLSALLAAVEGIDEPDELAETEEDGEAEA